jgi:hypothetical protein
MDKMHHAWESGLSYARIAVTLACLFHDCAMGCTRRLGSRGVHVGSAHKLLAGAMACLRDENPTGVTLSKPGFLDHYHDE